MFRDIKYSDCHIRKWKEYTSYQEMIADPNCLYVVSLTADADAPKGVARIMLDYVEKMARDRKIRYVAYGSRIPHYHKYKSQYNINQYVDAVSNNSIFDPVLSLIHVTGYRIQTIISGFYDDIESDNYGVVVSKAIKDIS